MKLGTCSRTYFYLLNREFGHPQGSLERAADPLAGGMMQEGHQCGMLWGAALAVGAESFRRYDDRGRAIGMAITATQYLIESFVEKTESVDCIDITRCDWSSKASIVKYFLTGKFLICFKLADKWAPDAIQSAAEGISVERTEFPPAPASCASEVAVKMGAGDEKSVIVAGLAGGLGLSGNGCGALAAAIWLNTIAWNRENTGKSIMYNPIAKKTLETFYEETGGEILCSKITGRSFDSIADHTEFLRNGGCRKLIEKLAQS